MTDLLGALETSLADHKSPTSDTRQLVTVATIGAIAPIPDADNIEAATVRGWTVVVRKDEFRPGDTVLYFEIDSLLPLRDERFAFLAPRGTKVIDGVPYHRLKTARLRGVYSQGLVLPIEQFGLELQFGLDLRAYKGDLGLCLGVRKYEPPLPSNVNAIGPFPQDLARKTDSERIQNLGHLLPEILEEGPWIATEKVDGMSATVARDFDGELHVCGRNWEIGEGDNPYWRGAGAILDMYDLAPGEAVQFEVYGQGIQGNPLGITVQSVAIFDFVRTTRSEHPEVGPQRASLPRGSWPQALLPFAAPIYEQLSIPQTVADIIAQADGIKSLISPQRLAEGIVWHQADGKKVPALDYRSTFKAISNKYLVKHDG